MILYTAWKKNVKIIEDSNREFSTRISEIDSALKEIPNTHSLRSLIITSIILKRWKKITNTDKIYVDDSRNWWWICGSDDHIAKKKETFNLVNELVNSKRKLLDKISNLRTLFEEAQQINNNNKNEINQREEDIRRIEREKSILIEENEQLKKELTIKIDYLDHKEVCNKLTDAQNTIKTLQKSLSKSTEQMVYLKHEISILRKKEMDFDRNKKEWFNKETNYTKQIKIM